MPIDTTDVTLLLGAALTIGGAALLDVRAIPFALGLVLMAVWVKRPK